MSSPDSPSPYDADGAPSMSRRRFGAGMTKLAGTLGLAGTAGATAAAAISVPATSAPQAVTPAASVGTLRPATPLLDDADAQEEQDLRDGTFLAAWQRKDGAKEFVLRLTEKQWQTYPGGPVLAAFAINDHVPGPVIRVTEGDRIRLVVVNDLPEPTSIHWHGMDLPNDQDGVPGLTQPPIDPGETYVYEWTAISTGTHWYHSHMSGDQEGRGIYGALEVVPRVGDFPADRDYRVILGDGALGFVLNGRSFPGTVALRAYVGERVRIRVIGAGPNSIHPLHLHGGFFEVVAQDGNPLPSPVRMDTVNVGVGQTFDLMWTPTRPGKWLMHCHIFPHSKGQEGMAGMVTVFHVDPPTVALPTLPG